jgi:hypothetical protein
MLFRSKFYLIFLYFFYRILYYCLIFDSHWTVPVFLVCLLPYASMHTYVVYILYLQRMNFDSQLCNFLSHGERNQHCDTTHIGPRLALAHKKDPRNYPELCRFEKKRKSIKKRSERAMKTDSFFSDMYAGKRR